MNNKLNPKSTNTDKVTEQDNGSLSDIKIHVDPREYRPIEVNISITMHDLQAHLVKVCYIMNFVFLFLILSSNIH